MKRFSQFSILTLLLATLGVAIAVRYWPAQPLSDLTVRHVDRSLAGKDWRTEYVDSNGKIQISVDGYGSGFVEGRAVVVT